MNPALCRFDSLVIQLDGQRGNPDRRILEKSKLI
jgi:hypothetical protein